MKRQPIAIAIDELVLDGFATIDQRRVGTAFRSEMERLIATRGVPAGLTGAALHAPAVSVTLEPGGSAEIIGTRVAQAIYRGWEAPAHRGAGAASATAGLKGGQR